MLKPKIGIDIMGSDASPQTLFEAVVKFASQKPFFEPVIFTNSNVLSSIPSPFEIIPAQNTIEMDDDPIEAIQNKVNSSLYLGLKALKEGKIDAFVSAGNTGALLVGSKTILETFPGIDRPALLALLPTKKKEVAVLDVGASTTAKPKNLLQFAVMGIAYQKSLKIQNPRVGLLNIGKESSKGTPQLQEAYEQLETLNQKKSLFMGNIEGRDVFEGEIDVLVTDGFSGNIFLKTVEGVAAFILEELEKNLPDKAKTLPYKLNYRDYPGAVLCGINSIVIKCHGEACPTSLINAIKKSVDLVESDFLTTLKDHLELLV